MKRIADRPVDDTPGQAEPDVSAAGDVSITLRTLARSRSVATSSVQAAATSLGNLLDKPRSYVESLGTPADLLLKAQASRLLEQGLYDGLPFPVLDSSLPGIS